MARLDMTEMADRILKLKNKKDKAKSQKDQLDGQIKGEYARMEKKFGIKSLAEAKKHLETMTENRDAEFEKLEKAVDSLESEMEVDYE